MAQEAKQRHGTSTEPAGSPVKLDKEILTPSDPPAISLDLSEHLNVASGILILLVQTYLIEADKNFQDEDFLPLFSKEALGQIRLTTHRWTLFLDTIKSSVSLYDPEFPIRDFINDALQNELSPNLTKFLTDLKTHVQAMDTKPEINKNGLNGTKQSESAFDKKARVTISVSLPQYEGLKGNAAKFVTKFTHLANTQNFLESEWDALLMDCLKREALKHVESSRRKFQTHKAYFKDLIEFFDHRSVIDERKWYRDTFKQLPKEPVRTFYLRFLETTEHLQSLDIFPPDDDKLYHQTFMDNFFCKLNEECYIVVNNKLRDSGKNPEDVTHTSFFKWIDTALQYNSSIVTLANTKNQNYGNSKQNSKNQRSYNENSNQQTNNSNPEDSYCYYCGKNGHLYKNKNKSWSCPDKLSHKPGCEEWYQYLRNKGWLSDKTSETTTNNKTDDFLLFE